MTIGKGPRQTRSKKRKNKVSVKKNKRTTRRFSGDSQMDKCSTTLTPSGNQIHDHCVSNDGNTIYLNNVEYIFDIKLNEGTYGSVAKYITNNTGTCIKSIAVKTFKTEVGRRERGESKEDYEERQKQANEAATHEFKNEKKACIDLFGFSDVVIESYYNDHRKMIIMTKYDYDLTALMFSNKCPIKVKCDFNSRFGYFCQVVDCLITLLKNNFVYTDLKANNVMYEVVTSSVVLVDIGGIFKNDGSREINAVFTFPHRGDGNKMIDAFSDIPIGTSCWDVPNFYKHYLQQVVSLYQTFVNNNKINNYVFMDEYEIKNRRLNEADFHLLHDEYFDKFDSPITNDIIIKELEGYKIWGNINNFAQYYHTGLINSSNEQTSGDMCVSEKGWWNSFISYYNMLKKWNIE
jgi:hypothetical protein